MALSELQWGLAGLGAVAVAGVWAYNKWQERAVRRQAENVVPQAAAPGQHAPDQEPQQRGDGRRPDPGAEPARPDGRVEPVLQGTEEEVPAIAVEDGMATVQPVAQPVREPPLELADPEIDCLIYLEPRQAIAGAGFWPAQRVHLGTLETRLRWLGLDARDGQWRELRGSDAASYARLGAALQLADRTGAVGEVQLSKFFIGLRQLSDDFGASVALPRAAEVLDRAHALDDFCASVDWRIAINVLAAADPAPDDGRLHRLLQSAGLSQREEGLFDAKDGDGQTLFTVHRIGALEIAGGEAAVGEGVTLTIDVPRVGDGVAAFDRMLDVARALAAALPGEIVDDQRVALKEPALAAIRAKVAEFQQKMAERQIPAGGPRALRLYS